MENGQLKDQLQTAELASAAQRANPLPQLTVEKEGASAAPDAAQLGELIAAFRDTPMAGAHMQQGNNYLTPRQGKSGQRLVESRSVTALSLDTPANAGAGVAAQIVRPLGSGDTVDSSMEDALLRNAISEWEALCRSVSACSTRGDGSLQLSGWNQ